MINLLILFVMVLALLLLLLWLRGARAADQRYEELHREGEELRQRVRERLGKQ